MATDVVRHNLPKRQQIAAALANARGLCDDLVSIPLHKPLDTPVRSAPTS